MRTAFAIFFGATVLMLLSLIGLVSFSDTYRVHEGLVVYENNARPTPQICSGLTVVLQNPKAHHTDGSVSGYCVGDLIDRPQLTNYQARKIDGSRFFYISFGDETTASNTELTMSDLTNLQNNIDSRNQTKDFPSFREEYTPKTVGEFNGLSVEERYWCSDSCPDNGILFLHYTSSTEENCEDLGGYKLYKFGWGSQYVGCSPTENKYSD